MHLQKSGKLDAPTYIHGNSVEEPILAVYIYKCEKLLRSYIQQSILGATIVFDNTSDIKKLASRQLV
jgi:hypothetical protein